MRQTCRTGRGCRLRPSWAQSGLVRPWRWGLGLGRVGWRAVDQGPVGDKEKRLG